MWENRFIYITSVTITSNLVCKTSLNSDQEIMCKTPNHHPMTKREVQTHRRVVSGCFPDSHRHLMKLVLTQSPFQYFHGHSGSQVLFIGICCLCHLMSNDTDVLLVLIPVQVHRCSRFDQVTCCPTPIPSSPPEGPPCPPCPAPSPSLGVPSSGRR